jgi:hypothetical protein
MTGTAGVAVTGVSVVDSVVASVVFVQGLVDGGSGQGVEAGVRRSVSHATLRSSNTLSCLEIGEKVNHIITYLGFNSLKSSLNSSFVIIIETLIRFLYSNFIFYYYGGQLAIHISAL